MDHGDHVALLRGGVTDGQNPQIWADLGSGTGAFTLALADLLGPGSTIVSVDRDRAALEVQWTAVARRFPSLMLEQHVADFRAPLDLPALDGLLMANSLHFVPRAEQVAVVRTLAAHLRPGGSFLVVEYDTNEGNQWVPYPFMFHEWEATAAEAGLLDTRQLGRAPGRWLGGFYSAASTVADDDPSRLRSASASRS